jgi:CRISPR-associated endonuclease/helicase Cas3
MECIAASCSIPSGITDVGQYRHMWAKSPDGEDKQGESLTAHTLRVWDNLLRLRERTPLLAELCGVPRFWTRSAIAVAIHDLGKCSAGFQSMLRGRGNFGHRHEVLSAVFLRWLLKQDPNGDLPWIAAAVLTHHKDLRDIHQRYRPADEVLGTADGLEELKSELRIDFYETAEALFRETLWPRMQESGIPLPASVGEAVQSTWSPDDGVRELRQTVDAALDLWQSIRRANATESKALAGRFARGVLIMADHAGSAWEKLRWAEELKSRDRMPQRLGLDEAALREHQRKAWTARGSAVLTAPTGSGKTEAALLWAANLGTRSEGHPVLFYVLPYQASLNAMRSRLGRVLGNESVALQHSRAVQALYRQLLEQDYESHRAQRLAKREVALARLHATPIRILTPYQLLRGAFQLKGHEAIWTDACGGLMVLDEIHAYEVARLGMILATLRHLARDLGVRVLVMSATLPSRLIHLLSDILPGSDRIVADAQTLCVFRRHRLDLVDAGLLEDVTVERIEAEARAGLAVLAVATTVGRAQELWGRLRQRLGDYVQLLHGRFHADDRFKKEVSLLNRRGKLAVGPYGPTVLVATQVVEVSLDVNFDVLYSDPAPLEALLQRFGRVNRWPEPGNALRDVRVMKRIPEGSPVYEEQVVRAAIAALQPVAGRALEEESLQAILDGVYQGETGEQWESNVRSAMNSFEREVLSSLRPFESDEAIEDRFEELFDGFEVLPKVEEHRYRERMELEPLLAPSLLVPVTSGQFWRMKRAGALERKDNVWVANRPYSADEGLQVKGGPRDDGV